MKHLNKQQSTLLFNILIFSLMIYLILTMVVFQWYVTSLWIYKLLFLASIGLLYIANNPKINESHYQKLADHTLLFISLVKQRTFIIISLFFFLGALISYIWFSSQFIDMMSVSFLFGFIYAGLNLTIKGLLQH